jgi:hypothetical protein
MKRLLVIPILLLCVSTSFARDNEFHGVVAAIERHYGVRHTHIPLLGFAMLFARPEGVSGFKLATFEGFHVSPAQADDDVRQVIEGSLGEGWHLFVRTHSRENGENTLIYANLSEGKFKMLIVSLEPGEATIVEMNLSDRAIKKWMEEPKESAKGQSNHGRQLAED